MKELKVSIVMPIYNRGYLLEKVLYYLTLQDYKNIEYIIVDDGSTDNTTAVAKSFGVEVFRLEKNSGKGAALQAGLELIPDSEIYFFLDADLVGLKENHLEAMLKPLAEEQDLVMTVGIFKGGRWRTDMAQVIAPQISGQRAFKKAFLDGLPDLSKSGFGCEVIINNHLLEKNFKYKEVYLEGAAQILKEEKMGYCRGFFYRLQMYWELFINWFKTRFLLV